MTLPSFRIRISRGHLYRKTNGKDLIRLTAKFKAIEDLAKGYLVARKKETGERKNGKKEGRKERIKDGREETKKRK